MATDTATKPYVIYTPSRAYEILDSHNDSAFKSELERIVNDSPYDLILDLCNIRQITNEGLVPIVGLRRILKEKSKELKIAGLQKNVRSKFDTTGFYLIFNIFDTVEDAEKSYQ